MADTEPTENDSILTTETTQITISRAEVWQSVICLRHIRPTRTARDADSY